MYVDIFYSASLRVLFIIHKSIPFQKMVSMFPFPVIYDKIIIT